MISATACASDYLKINAAGGEDEDIGLGGTGLLANTGYGLGGTGIIGEITGFGSIFVNGIEIEYDNKTPFTVDGKKAVPQQLAIGDVVEILTTDANTYTQAQVINLRHEVIGRVESVDPQTFSYTVLGQTIIQKSDKGVLPEVGTTVAVSGMRIDKQTIVSTRTTSTETEQTLLRTHTELPFEQQAARWSVQMHVENGQANIHLDGASQILATDNNLADSLKGISDIKILDIHKSEAGQLKLEKVTSPSDIPLGQTSAKQKQQFNGNRKQRTINTQPRMIRGVR